MNMKRVIIVGTMIVTMSFAGTAWSKSAITPIPLAKWSIISMNATDQSEQNEDALLHALNQTTDAEFVRDLYAGKSLRMIAEQNDGDIDAVIALQVTQLSKQLDERLANGSISLEQYTAQQSELISLVTESANTSYLPI
ncbi:hypothetical protein [Paenibacillus sp. MER 99-2]|uniref:hypothetical protein n=1 Tax=Paenibacillus sp. MER 99-2 TaxID=2939572 RepID=UPI00203B2375|nr:hypothetical protein [Paenibacillus sp. MER 99-2]MCM3173392.1 hypothetical protein [Paenibacillus sp. MER 99-2]